MSNTKKPEVPTTPTTDKEPTESENIWNEIKGLPIEMFALPNQVVEQHVFPYPFHVDPSRLLATIRSTSVLPALESAIDAEFKKNTTLATVLAARGKAPLSVKKYKVELNDKFVSISRATPELILPTKK